MKKKELINQLAIQVKTDSATAEKWVNAITEIIYNSLEHRETVTLQGFGTFYIRERSRGTVFKFSPSQKMRSMLGWSSTYST